jgi:hypothetical protein
MLAAAMSLNLYCLVALRRGGLGTEMEMQVLDRVYDVPRLVVFAGVAVATALIPVGLYVLSARRREAA